jgi:type IV secretion system protein VirB2
MIETGSIVPSLADPPPSSVFAAATGWISSTLLGSTATTIAVIAVALVGFMMLTGRFHVRRSLSVLLGCFILFGATAIVSGLREFSGLAHERNIDSQVNAEASEFDGSRSSFRNSRLKDSDPYAGAGISH